VFRFGGEDSRGGVGGLDLRVFFGEFVRVLGEPRAKRLSSMALALLRRQLSVATRWASWISRAPSGANGCDHGGGECVVSDAIFVSHGGYLAGQVMAAGVVAGGAFAFLGFGPG